MKKQISTVMLLTIFIFSAFTSTAGAQTSQPLAADGGALDFVINSRSFEVDYCNEYIIAKAVVTSPSNSTPEVLAEINGANVTMIAPLMKLDGSLNNKFFAAGITYYAYVNTPTVGQYNLTIHAGNSSGFVASSMFQTQYNKTLMLQSMMSNGTGDAMRVNCTDYLFYLNEYISSYECVTSVTVNINGTVYTMSYSPYMTIFSGGWDYAYTHQFGSANVDRAVNYNFSVNTATGSYFVDGGSFTIFNATDESEYSSSFVDERYNDKYEVDWGIEYHDGLNRPLQLLISINGSANATVNLTSAWDYQMEQWSLMMGMTIEQDPIGEEWLWCDEVEGIFTFTLEYGVYYNISLWWSNGNGTWFEDVLATNMQIPDVKNLAAPTIAFSALDATVQNGQLFVSGNITVTSDIQSVGINGYMVGAGFLSNMINVNLNLPEAQDNTFATAVDPLDTNFADGKVYKFNASVWNDYREYWGDVLLSADIYYGNTTESKQASFNKVTLTGKITRAPGVVGEYKVKEGLELNIITTTKEKACCEEMIVSTQTQTMIIEKIVNVDGTDVIVVSASGSFGATKISVKMNQTLNAGGSAKLLYNSIEFVAPSNEGIYDKILEYWNEFPLEVAKATVKSNALTGIVTFSYNQTIGDFEIKVMSEYDKNGVMRSHTFQKYHKGELIYEEVTMREMSFLDKLFLDYLWYAVIGVVALVAIVVIVMKMKSK